MIHKLGISIGHSLKDCGAVAMHEGTTYKEYDLNVALTRQIMTTCPKNAYWYRTDTDCEDEPYPEHLRHTVRNINNSDVLCAVEIHHNSCGNPNREGCELIYWDTSQQGYLMARYISVTLQDVPLKVNIIPAVKQLGRKLYFLRKTRVPALVIEPAFMSNYRDMDNAIRNKKEIAQAINDGMARWVEQYNE